MNIKKIQVIKNSKSISLFKMGVPLLVLNRTSKIQRKGSKRKGTPIFRLLQCFLRASSTRCFELKSHEEVPWTLIYLIKEALNPKRLTSCPPTLTLVLFCGFGCCTNKSYWRSLKQKNR